MEQECGDSGDVVTDIPTTYAGIAGSGTHKITFTLEADKKNDFHVTVKDVAKLVYGRLNAPPKSLISFDDTMYKKLTITLSSVADISKINLSHGLEIREGLRTKPILAPNKEKDIHIYWAPMELDNKKIEDVLKQFGTLSIHGVMNKKYVAKEDDDDITKMMDGVVLTDRMARITITHPIPSHILVENIKLKVVYEGQARTCGRCYKFWSNCPGNGKTDLCKAKEEAANEEKKKNGEKASKAPTMRANWNRLTKKMEDHMKNGINANISKDLVAGPPPPPTCLRVTSLPADITLPELINVMKSNNCGEIEELDDKISFGKVPGTAVIRDLDHIDFELITENLDGVFLRGKRFKVTPIQERTPEKSQPSTADPEDAPASPSAPPPPPPSSSPLQVSENVEKNKDDHNSVLRTPVKTVQQLAEAYEERTTKKALESKSYTRISQSGKKISSKKTLRLSSDEDTSPQTTRVKKRSKNSSFKH